MPVTVLYSFFINAVLATSRVGIRSLITVEKDLSDNNIRNQILNSPHFEELFRYSHFQMISNSWMAFQSGAPDRGAQLQDNQLTKGCDQVFENLVLTPNNLLSSCCGLTFEHIPEMKIGELKTGRIKQMYLSQFDDFLKFWIKVSGPTSIIKDLMPEGFIEEQIGQIDHICQACAHLHKHPDIKKKLYESYKDNIETVMAKFMVKYQLAEAGI